MKAVVLFLLAAPLVAHDFWIEPTRFQPEAGETIGFALRFGEGFRGQPVPRDPRAIEKFVAVSHAGETPVQGVLGRDPAGVARISSPGWVVVGYRSKPKSIELPAEKFESYLKEEGLEKVVEARAARGESRKSGREIYSRCAKSLVDVGGAGSGGYDRALAFRLELVPERSPKEVGGGRSMPVRLLFDGKPLAGALVVAMSREDPSNPLSARSDASGRVSLPLPTGGMWLVKAVHMVRAPASSGADWESLWASLTFEVP